MIDIYRCESTETHFAVAFWCVNEDFGFLSKALSQAVQPLPCKEEWRVLYEAHESFVQDKRIPNKPPDEIIALPDSPPPLREWIRLFFWILFYPFHWGRGTWKWRIRALAEPAEELETILHWAAGMGSEVIIIRLRDLDAGRLMSLIDLSFRWWGFKTSEEDRCDLIAKHSSLFVLNYDCDGERCEILGTPDELESAKILLSGFDFPDTERAKLHKCGLLET